MKAQTYAKLPTEQINPRSRRIDRMSVKQALEVMSREDFTLPQIVKKAHPEIQKAIKTVVSSMKKGGRLIILGAGTSGRLGILEAAECPPTFNTAASLVQSYMAGGKQSVFRSKEGAEDRGRDAVRIVRQKAKPSDVVLGVAASGITSFVKEGLREAKRKKCKTILVTCFPKVSKASAHIIIGLKTGPEVISGSTRLKAATATKMVLNMITVLSMVQLGKVYGNLMVDLQPKSKKLKARALRLIQDVGRVKAKKAHKLLSQSKGNVKTAIAMARKKLTYTKARKKLNQADGHLHKVIQ